MCMSQLRTVTYPERSKIVHRSPFLLYLLFLSRVIMASDYFDTLQFKPPRFTTQPLGSTVSEGTKKILQCHATGYPQPMYKWLKDGVPLGEFSKNQFYLINNTTSADTGSYQCVAKNVAGAILSKAVDVVVAYMGTFADVNSFQTVVSGHAAVLKLPHIECVPAPSVTWITDEGPLGFDMKYALSEENELIILSAEETDQKGYRARALNTQLGREEWSNFIYLNVSGDPYSEIAPEIVVKPKTMQIVKGQTIVKLLCVANARPLHQLETLWRKDDISIANSGVGHSLSSPWNRSLSLLSIDSDHSGKYTCQVRLRTGGFQSAVASAYIEVLETPTFLTPLSQDTVAEYGGSLKISCNAVGQPPPQITWLKNADPITFGDNRYKLDEDNTLIIEKLTLSDSGMFQCMAENVAGQTTSYTWLKVNTSEHVTETYQQNMTVTNGIDVTISCRGVEGFFPNVTWYYNISQRIETSDRLSILQFGDLSISNVKETDAGLYTCTRSNENGTVITESYLHVTNQTETVQPPVDTVALIGTTVFLECKSTGDHSTPSRLSWFKDESSIEVTNSTRLSVSLDGTLKILSVRAVDVGVYTCIVASANGNTTKSTKLNIMELPYAPTNVKAVRIEPKSVNVSWTPAFDGNSQILFFIIQKRETSDLDIVPDSTFKWITTNINASATRHWVVLKRLKAGSSYQFRISAVNRVGEGLQSELSNVVNLPQEAPSGPPLDFEGAARSSSEIILHWRPPREDLSNGFILGYLIRYRLFGYTDIQWTYHNITNGTQRNFMIEDLITWKDYFIQIAAHNKIGVGVYTEGIRIKTKQGTPSAPPENVRCAVVNSTAVKVIWLPPNPQQINGINQGFKIQIWRTICETDGCVEIEDKMVTVAPNLHDPAAEQDSIVENLEPFTFYNVTVLCFTEPGDGVRSEKIPIQTKEDKPQRVSTLSFNEISDRSVKISWTAPKRSNGVLTGYELKYQVKDKPETVKTLNVTSKSLSVKINDLQSKTHYLLNITAWTKVGSSLPRSGEFLSGDEPVLPMPPTQLAVSNIGPFSVALQFTRAFDGNSPIKKWIVEAQTARNTSWLEIFESPDTNTSVLIVNGLTPFTEYRLRLIATNRVGSSSPSNSTNVFQTIQSRPLHPPLNVTLRAISATKLRVRWIPLKEKEWSGNPRGYNITYKQIDPYLNSTSRSVIIEDHTANFHVLENLNEWSTYEVIMNAFNDVGTTEDSHSAVQRTRESVPSFGPLNVSANATSSTTIVVGWGEVPRQHRNGQIDGYKVFYGSTCGNFNVKTKVIYSNATFMTTLTQLKKYYMYHIQICAFTRLGDGHLSSSVCVRTFDDFPGKPSNVSFPDVTFSTARIIWDVPAQPNGEILAYKVTYSLNNTGSMSYSREFSSSCRNFRATHLIPESYYMFLVTARTRLGWGKPASVLVLTTNYREKPAAPSAPTIARSQIQANQITFSWIPGYDGLAPLRYYTVELCQDDDACKPLPERLNPFSTAYTVTNLKPYTTYQFRIKATNDVGVSAASRKSEVIRTLPAAPSEAVTHLRVVPLKTSSILVQWKAISNLSWNGDLVYGGYRVFCHPVSNFPNDVQASTQNDIMGIKTESTVLSNLEEDRAYEIVVTSFNSQGSGPPTSPVIVYVGEAILIGEPHGLHATPTSSTEVHLKWEAPRQTMKNGDILGYKILYIILDSPQDTSEVDWNDEEVELVLGTTTSHTLVFLEKFTKYQIQVLAFNAAGDGPRSQGITVRTFEDLPGPPEYLRFQDITMHSVTVYWDLPTKRNGIVRGYLVTYETAEKNDKYSKQVKQEVNTTSITIHNLEEQMKYKFNVRAVTIDSGPAVSGNVTTGPQEGSPMAPRDFVVQRSVSNVVMHWKHVPSERAPLLGYYIESKKRGDYRWVTVGKTMSGSADWFSLSFQNFLPSTVYSFRVSSYNEHGISYPTYSIDSIQTPSQLYVDYGYIKKAEFYRQTWFVLSVAAGSVLLVLFIVAVILLIERSKKFKKEVPMTLDDLNIMPINERERLTFGLLKMCQSRDTSVVRSTSSLGQKTFDSTFGRKTEFGKFSVGSTGKSPPKPSPASVMYHSDEDSLKYCEENTYGSSITEKPSEISSTDSQFSESENESTPNYPHSFVNHYANINASLKQSWRKLKPVKYHTNYTDFNTEGSTAIGLNGGQIIMNNMAGSRAPLPGFSSFV